MYQRRFSAGAARFLLVVFFASLLSGCFTMMETSGGEERKPIAIGMTMETVKSRFGSPTEVEGANREGQTWMYRLSEACYDCESGWETITVDLQFDEYGTLESIHDLPGRYIKATP